MYRRFVVVAWHFLPLLLAYARDRRRFVLFGRPRRVSSTDHRRRAEVLLDSMVTLGPTFIKFGQLLSTRPDALPPEYIDVLSALQDRVPPAPWVDAKRVLEDEVGPIDAAYDDFDPEPISGASLGQVYRARVEDRDVAVKVRRPGVETLVETDLRVIGWSIPVLLRFVDESRAFSLSNLAEEFSRVIRQEMDYEREAAMLAEIGENFAGDDRYEMPPVVESHSSERVLTMEYLPGIKITDVEALERAGHDRSRLAEHLQRAYMRMIVDDGVFHADPHPGNLAVNERGQIVFYDFGMSGRVDAEVQEQIVRFYVAAARRDIDELLDSLTNMGTLSPEADRALMAEVTELAIQDARGEAIEDYRIQQIVRQVEDSIYEFPLRLPSNLALVLRVATVVEGVCVTLDPDYDFIEVASAYLTEEGYRRAGARRLVEETGEQVRESTEAALRTPPKVERMLDRFDRNDFYVRTDLEDSDALLETLAKRVIYGMLLSVGLFSIGLLYALEAPDGALVAAIFSGVVAIQLYRSFRSRRRFGARPQFTRQNLRRRRGPR